MGKYYELRYITPESNLLLHNNTQHSITPNRMSHMAFMPLVQAASIPEMNRILEKKKNDSH